VSRITLRAIENKLEMSRGLVYARQRKSNRNAMQLDQHEVKQETRLQKTEHGSNDTHDTSSGGGNVHGVGGTGLGGLGARATAAGGGANTGGLGDGTVAEVLAANLRARLQLLESVTALELSRGLDVESTINLVESRSRDVGEVTVKVESASNSGKLGETVDDHEVGVVLDGETTTNLLQLREGDVVEVLVGDDGQVTLVGTDSGKVGALQRLELVGVETERTVDGGERVEGNGGDVAEGHVVGPDQVGEDGRDVTTVGLNVERGGDVTELHGDVVQVVVVGNEDSVDNSKVNTVKSLELSVLDVQLAGLLNTGGEGQKLETSKGVPLDGVNLAELGEGQSRKNLELVKLEGTANDLEAVGRDGGNLGVVGCDKITRDCSNTRDGDRCAKARGNGDGAREGGAGREGRGISRRLDGGGTGDAARALGVGTADGSECRNKVLHRHCEGGINLKVYKLLQERKRWDKSVMCRWKGPDATEM